MTREEEAIEELKILKEDYWEDDGYGYATAECQKAISALDMAIEALEQQTCEDCISRQAVLALPTSKTKTLSGEIIEEEVNIELIKALPSVVPKEKTGRWIEIKSSKGTTIALRCSCCGNSPKRGISSDYCPNCGAKMQEVSE